MATKRSFDESEHPGNDDTLLHKHARANGTYLGFDSSLEAGSVVKCIILQSSGALEEVSLDLSPTLGQIDEVVGGTPRLEYAFESSGISVISCKSHQEDESIPVNKHKMQPPLKHAALRGDILLVKKNASCGPDNLTAQEWQEFMALDIPDDEDIEGDDEEDVDAEHNDEIFL